MTNRTTYHCEEMPDGKIVCTPVTGELIARRSAAAGAPDDLQTNTDAGEGRLARIVRPLPEYTYEDGEGPKCPFCGIVWTADEPQYYDENGWEDECSECGNQIRIEPIISVSWKTLPIRWANARGQAIRPE